MVAQGPTCALARASYMTSTRAKAPHKHHPKWPLFTPRQRSHFTLRLTGGMDASLISEMKHLQAENARLKRMYTDKAMQNELVKEALVKKK